MAQPILEDLSDLVIDSDVQRSKDFLGEEHKIQEVNSFISDILKEAKNKENLIIFLRCHWISFLAQLLPYIGLIFLLTVGIILSIQFLSPVQAKFLHLIFPLLGLFIWNLLFITFIDYYLDVWIVTDRRIVDIEQKGLFRREISELRFENVQDVTTEITGIIPTFFDYGNLFVQTAGKRERFIFKNIPHPGRVRDIILVLSDRTEA